MSEHAWPKISSFPTQLLFYHFTFESLLRQWKPFWRFQDPLPQKLSGGLITWFSTGGSNTRTRYWCLQCFEFFCVWLSHFFRQWILCQVWFRYSLRILVDSKDETYRDCKNKRPMECEVKIEYKTEYVLCTTQRYDKLSTTMDSTIMEFDCNGLTFSSSKKFLTTFVVWKSNVGSTINHRRLSFGVGRQSKTKKNSSAGPQTVRTAVLSGCNTRQKRVGIGLLPRT